MSTVIELLEQIENTQGTNAKRALLEANKTNFLLRQTFQVVLDPYLNYGVVKIKKQKPVARKACNEGIIIAFNGLLLGELSDRELSGNDAREAVESIFAQANDLEQKWLDRMIKRNLRNGVSTSIVNDIWPGTVRGFSTSLCDTLKVKATTLKPKDIAALRSAPANGQILNEKYNTYLISFGGETIRMEFKQPLPTGARCNPKLDGLRCVALKRAGKVTLKTRNGNDIDTLPEIVAALEEAPYDDYMLDAEAMAEGDEAWNDSMSVIGSTKNAKDTSGMYLNVFDSMPIAEWDAQLSTQPYGVRDAAAGRIVKLCGDPIRHVPTVVCRDYVQLLTYYIQCLDDGYEGLVIKDPSATYRFERSEYLLKFKPEATYEGSVIGWFKGSRGSKRADKFAGFWFLLPNGVATRCGTGFKDDEKAAFHAEIQKNGMGKYLGAIGEVKGQPPLTKEGKIRFPRFKRWRSPKDVDPAVMQAASQWVAKGSIAPAIER